MTELRPGFIRLPRLEGDQAIVRADAITALLPQEGIKGGPRFIIVQLSTHLTVRTTLSEERILRRMASAGAVQRIVVSPEAPDGDE